MALIKCTECGHEVSDKAQTCPNCGAPVSLAQPSNQQLNNTYSNIYTEGSSSKKWLYLVVGILAVSLLGLAAWLFLFNEDKQNQTKQIVDSKSVTNVEKDTSSSGKDIIDNQSMNLKGKIGKYPITMHLEFDNKNVSGYYSYNSGSSKLLLKGTINNNHIELNETTEEGRSTGHFDGKLTGDKFAGEFINYKGEHFNFTLANSGVTQQTEDLSMQNDIQNDDYSFRITKGGYLLKTPKKDVPVVYSEQLVELAEKGNAEAMFKLSRCYKNGIGVEKNYDKAVELIFKSAENGYVEAQLALGVWLLESHPQEGFKWLYKAAEQGNAMAQQNIGFCYEKGIGIAQNYSEAFKWTKKAAEQDLIDAQWFLGDYYKKGIGTNPNPTEAVKWYRKAADKNSPHAQYEMFKCYILGIGVEPNLATANEWLIKAAEQGDWYARYNLAVAYYNGEGFPQDENKAVRMLQELAQEGFQDAAIALHKIGK